MPARITNEVLASKIDDLAEDIAELKGEMRTINHAHRKLDLRVSKLETKEEGRTEQRKSNEPIVRPWSLENPRILLLSLTAIVLLVELLGRVI